MPLMSHSDAAVKAINANDGTLNNGNLAFTDNIELSDESVNIVANASDSQNRSVNNDNRALIDNIDQRTAEESVDEPTQATEAQPAVSTE
eukprot:scaffold380180_cov17-Prasinocladus_malaysianus.AAC.1